MSKPLKDIPHETLERWRRLSTQKSKLETTRNSLPNIKNSKIPSLHLLKSEIDALRNARNPEEIQEIRAHIDELHDRVMQESEDIRQEAMKQVESLKQLRMMMSVAPQFMASQNLYECPKCHRKWGENELNYSIRRKGKHKKMPWCPFCNIQIYAVGDKRLKEEVIVPVREKRLDVTFKKLT